MRIIVLLITDTKADEEFSDLTSLNTFTYNFI